VIVVAYAAARGVTLTGAAAYGLMWLLIAGSSRFSMSALGLQFAPPGSASLDTVAVMLLLVPAGILTSCLGSQTPTLEATRSRRCYPSQQLWVGVITVVAVLSPLTVAPILHRSIDVAAFFITWCITLGTWLIIASFASTIVAATVTFMMLAGFSTPNLVPWRANIVYNLEAKNAASLIAAILFLGGAALPALVLSRR
jgi:hypothetical protein